MKHLRFILCVIGAYAIGFVVVIFFAYSAITLQEARIMLAGTVLVPLIMFFFGWLYFRGVRDITWRQRAEAIAVWMGLTFIVDVAILYLWFHGTLSDLGTMAYSGYGLELLALFVAAYITASHEPKLSSPDLKIV